MENTLCFIQLFNFNSYILVIGKRNGVFFDMSYIMDRYMKLERKDLIIGVPIMIIIIIKLASYDKNLATIIASCTVLLVMRTFIDEKLMKVVVKVMAFLLLPTIMLVVSQYYPKVLLIDIRKLYLLIIINTIIEIFFNRVREKIQSKINSIMEKFCEKF